MGDKIKEEELFNKIYIKGYDDRQINQLLMLYSLGYDLSYIEVTTSSDKLRELRNYFKNGDEKIIKLFERAISEKRDIMKFLPVSLNDDRIGKILTLDGYEIDTNALMQPELSNEQFDLLAKLLNRETDISWYSDASVSYEKMKISADAEKKGINLSKYIEKFDDKQYKIIFEAYEYSKEKKPINISFLEDAKLSHQQMEIILLGLKNGVNVSKYASPKYSPLLMTIFFKFLQSNINVDWIPEVFDKYSEKQFEALYKLFEVDKDIALNICKDGYNAGQILFIADALKQGKNIENILNASFSIERMKLILENNNDEYKDLSISDLQLHLKHYKFIKSEKDKINLETLSTSLKNQLLYNTDKMYTDFNNVDYIFPRYFMYEDQILEVACINDEMIEDAMERMHYDTDIHVLSMRDLLYIYSRNEDKFQKFTNEIFIIDYNTESEKFEILNLITNKRSEIKTFDYSDIKEQQIGLLFNRSTYSDYFDVNPALSILEYLNIDLNKYFLTEDVYDKKGRPAFKLCYNIENIKKTYTFPGVEDKFDRAEFILQNKANELECLLAENYFSIYLYSRSGHVIDSESMLSEYTVEHMLNEEFYEFVETRFTSFKECVESTYKDDVDR